MTPLEGFRVVELGVWIAGPASAGLLAEWGADVIKVEPPTGDPQRHVFAQVGLPDVRMPAFEMDNRGKRSIVLDLKTDQGAAAMRTLLRDADVFVTNLRVRALTDLGLDPDTLRAEFPRLVYGLVTGYGSTGPDADRAGYDVGAFWARSGAASSHTLKEIGPPGLAPSFGDHITAMALVSGVCAALASRATSGEGTLVETSLLRTGMYCVSADLSTAVHHGSFGRALGRHEAASPVMNSYVTEDGRWLWLLCLESDRHWPNVIAAVDRPDWGEDPRYATSAARYKNRRELIAELDAIFSARAYDEWVEILTRHDVWFTPMNTAQDLVDDPQVAAVNGYVEIPGSAERSGITSVASPVDFNRQRPVPVRASPSIGEHTAEVTAEFDLDTN